MNDETGNHPFSLHLDIVLETIERFFLPRKLMTVETKIKGTYDTEDSGNDPNATKAKKNAEQGHAPGPGLNAIGPRPENRQQERTPVPLKIVDLR